MGEFYFNPHLSGAKYNRGIHHTVLAAVKACDLQHRAAMMKDIRITSVVHIKGMAERLQQELRLMATYEGFDDVEINVRCVQCWE